MLSSLVDVHLVNNIVGYVSVVGIPGLSSSFWPETIPLDVKGSCNRLYLHHDPVRLKCYQGITYAGNIPKRKGVI